MFVKELYAKLEDLQAQGREAVKAKDEVKAQEIKAQLAEVNAELKEAISFAEEQEELKAKARQIEGGTVVTRTIEGLNLGGDKMKAENKFETVEYKNAVLDDLRGVATAEQVALIAEANNHTTGNTGTVIPNTVVGRIWTKVEEMHPMYADVPKTYIAGNVSYDRQTNAEDNGSWLGEDEATPSVTLKFDTLDLTGHELSKSVDISFKLDAMSRVDFENHLVQELSKKVGKALAVAIYSGTGVKMPRGIKTALLADDADQIVNYTEMGYSDLTAMFGKLKSGLLSGAVVYANNQTIWNTLANITDKNGRPVLVTAVTNDRVATIFGVPVRESAEAADGEVLLANHEGGYKCNIQPEVGTGVERDNRNRVTGHFMHIIADGGVLDTKAYVLAQPAQTRAKK